MRQSANKDNGTITTYIDVEDMGLSESLSTQDPQIAASFVRDSWVSVPVKVRVTSFNGNARMSLTPTGPAKQVQTQQAAR